MAENEDWKPQHPYTCGKAHTCGGNDLLIPAGRQPGDVSVDTDRAMRLFADRQWLEAIGVSTCSDNLADVKMITIITRRILPSPVTLSLMQNKIVENGTKS